MKALKINSMHELMGCYVETNETSGITIEDSRNDSEYQRRFEFVIN